MAIIDDINQIEQETNDQIAALQAQIDQLKRDAASRIRALSDTATNELATQIENRAKNFDQLP